MRRTIRPRVANGRAVHDWKDALDATLDNPTNKTCLLCGLHREICVCEEDRLASERTMQMLVGVTMFALGFIFGLMAAAIMATLG